VLRHLYPDIPLYEGQYAIIPEATTSGDGQDGIQAWEVVVGMPEGDARDLPCGVADRRIAARDRDARSPRECAAEVAA